MRRLTSSNAAFTLVENMVALALASLLGLSLVGMMVLSGKLTRAAREQLTAAEIVEGKIDALRSCSWAQLKRANFIPATFSVTNGIPYWGTISNGTPSGSETYISNLLEVAVSIHWQTDGRPRTLTTKTLISSDGLSAE